MMPDFHWLRPLWFFGFIPLLGVMIYLWRYTGQRNPWQQQIAPHLLPHLLIQERQPASRIWLLVLALGWGISLLALAGPTWQKRPQPTFKPNQALVILLDLSLSMNATDIEPSRLDRAKFKIKDILQQQIQEQHASLFALVSYAGDAHVVTPLTDDHNTIEAMLPALNSLIMPIPGSRPDLAVQTGLQLIKQAQLNSGKLLLITDDISSANLSALQKVLTNSTISLSILGIGTAQGAPIPLPNGSFIKSDTGQPVMARLDHDKMRLFAEQLNARYAVLSADDQDLQSLLTDPLPDINTPGASSTQRFDDWQDEGVWLVLLLLPLVAGLFRRGWIWMLVLIPLGLPTPSQAFEWQDLWLTKPQQAQRAYQQQNYAKATEQFADPAYKGLAAYRQGDYQQASELLSAAQDVTSLYNLGNALAKSQQYAKAIAAYDQVLKQQPEHKDAAFNKALVEKLAKQQKQQNSSDKNNKSDQKDKQDQSQKDSQNQQQNQNSQDQQQAQNQQSQDQNSQDQNSQDQQSKESNAKKSQQNSDKDQQQSAEPPSEQDQQKTAEQNGQGSPAPSDTPSSHSTPKPLGNHAASGEPSQSPAETPQQAADKAEQNEQHQALEQWLEQVPDDPSGLLRRKFLLQSQQENSRQSNQSQQNSNSSDQQGYW